MAEKYYITTPIFYPNEKPHIGHAYTVIASDTLARFARLDGKDVFFLSGTDEHGLKMQQTAEKEGITPLELADRNSAIFRTMIKALDGSNDEFFRTTELRHYKACQTIWERMAANGDIYLGCYSGWYSVRQEAYFDEKETTVGEDGIRREPLGSAVEWNEEESYFFRLSSYQDKILDLYKRNPEFVGPVERRNEVASFVKSGLKDLSVSRSTFNWGIPVPGDEKHVMYVWVDALTNYITAAGYPDMNSEKWSFWPADVHMIGKDIVRFHAVYWPAFLMSAGIEIPKRIFAHGFLFNRGEKMSKSVGNVVDPFDLVSMYGCDAVRYFFLREVIFGQDGSHSPELIINRINADLANNLGNLAQRSLSMIFKNYGGAIPQPSSFSKADETILAATDGLYVTVRMEMDKEAITRYLDAVWSVIVDANRYFAAEQPWVKKKTDPARMAPILYATAECVRQFAILIQPIMPDSASKLLDLLAVAGGDRSFVNLGSTGRLRPGTRIPKPQGVFPRYVAPELSGRHVSHDDCMPQEKGE